MLTTEDYTKLLQLTDKILNRKSYSYFYTIPDYSQEPIWSCISNPISINLIKTKLIDQKYSNVDDYFNDFRIMKQNYIHIYGEKSLTSNLFSVLFSMVEKEFNNLKSNFGKKASEIEDIFNLKFDINQISKEDAIQIVSSLNNEKVSLNFVLKKLHCKKKNKFIEHLSNFDLEIQEFKKGRKPLNISEVTIQNISEIHNTWKIGYKHMGETLQISEWMTRKVYKNLYKKDDKKQKKNNLHQQRYHAKTVNNLWHSDIHYLKGKPPFEKETHYLIAFIDDCSRKILHFETGIYKDMQFTSIALTNCLKKLDVKNWPFQLTTDNGLEFRGHLFEEALIHYGILHYYIKPRNPEENAKIERWWQIISKLENYSDIGIAVELYNNSLTHSVLNSTPSEAYEKIPHFDMNVDSIFNQIEYTP